VFHFRSHTSSRPRLHPGATAVVALSFAILLAGCAGYVSPNSPTSSGALALSASSFDFKTVVVGQSSAQTLTVSNSGKSAVQLTGVSVSNRAFTIAGPALPQTIAPSKSLSFKLSFAPTATGTAGGTLTITSDAKTATPPVSLSGSGEKAFANLVVTPPSINFGSLALKSTATQNVTLQNTGDINMTIQGITVAGAGFGYSSISPGFSLAPNQQVTFQVWFAPKTAGAASATVSFLSPSLSSPETLALSGNGATSGGANPPPPTATPHTVHLSWTASASQIVGYRVYRSETSGGSYIGLSGSAITTPSYDDTTVSDGTTYYYVVTAVDSSGNESVYSNQATATIPAS